MRDSAPEVHLAGRLAAQRSIEDLVVLDPALGADSDAGVADSAASDGDSGSG
jgi:hypothetical protein